MVAPRSAHPTHAHAPRCLLKYTSQLVTFMPCTPATGRSSGWRHEHGTTAWTRRELTCPLHRIAIRRLHFDLSCLRLSRICQEYWNATPGSCIPSLSLRAIFLTTPSPRHVIVSRPLRRPTTKLPHCSLPATIACHLQYAGLEATARGPYPRPAIAAIPHPSLHPYAHTLRCICPHVALYIFPLFSPGL